jgi:hypothetical protein
MEDDQGARCLIDAGRSAVQIAKPQQTWQAGASLFTVDAPPPALSSLKDQVEAVCASAAGTARPMRHASVCVVPAAGSAAAATGTCGCACGCVYPLSGAEEHCHVAQKRWV